MLKNKKRERERRKEGEIKTTPSPIAKHNGKEINIYKGEIWSPRKWEKSSCIWKREECNFAKCWMRDAITTAAATAVALTMSLFFHRDFFLFLLFSMSRCILFQRSYDTVDWILYSSEKSGTVAYLYIIWLNLQALWMLWSATRLQIFMRKNYNACICCLVSWLIYIYIIHIFLILYVDFSFILGILIILIIF